jgi:hypothetical protein
VEPPLWGDRGRSEEREIARWRCLVREGGVVHALIKTSLCATVESLSGVEWRKSLNETPTSRLRV